MQDQFDVVVVGAGAAGIAAAARLSRSPLSVVVLEGQGRIGGRAHTLLARTDLPLDLGCGWLHSADRNPLVPLFERRDIPIDRSEPAWARPEANLSLTPEDGERFGAALAAFEARLEAAAAEGGEGRASAYLPGVGRWAPMIEAFSGYYNGAGLSQVSIQDYGAYEDTGVNWRAPEGYGAAICALADRSLIVPHCAVLSIDHSRTPLVLETARGPVSARAVVVTVSSDLIARESIRLTPGLPEKVDAATGVPLGLANKVFLSPTAPEAFGREQHLWGRTDTAETGSYYLRPLGRPIIEAFFGGAHARALEAEGPRAAAAFAIEELVGHFGAGVRRQLKVMAETGWASDPWALGAYSHALPGCAPARQVLAAPVEDRLFFAGEATSKTAFSTAHGAWESGLRAADEVLLALRVTAA
ncbi:MAG: flavin monoamine oxidase family protein [Pseudomonadota bacterium]